MISHDNPVGLPSIPSGLYENGLTDPSIMSHLGGTLPFVMSLMGRYANILYWLNDITPGAKTGSPFNNKEVELNIQPTCKTWDYFRTNLHVHLRTARIVGIESSLISVSLSAPKGSGYRSHWPETP